ncbi:hypothetical protein GN958_ATG22264 [Phytophthora infestans]|uniref:Mucin-like protein n=1 Tax=Phytophthora infestans TaxID=4787 RepID=A0A8S9TI96_PHYIN|nr:hypothetical protein GN958_ATG22264 [Phytophthora infestans]
MFTAAAFASAAVLAASTPSTNAHGYMLIPKSQFKGSANSAWIVQIDPVWASESWDGNNAGSVETFKSLKTANNFKDLKTLMDDTSVYGADCGFTDPNGKAQPIPKDGKATFSRALVHVGPCEIWLDDTKVLYEDDCFSKYGNENQDIKSVFPVDYSSCSSGGCKEMQDCIPLEGAGGTSTITTTSQTSQSTGADSETPSGDRSSKSSSGDSNTPSSESNTPSSGDSNTPSTGESNSLQNSPPSGESQNSWTGNTATPAPESGTTQTGTWMESPSWNTWNQAPTTKDTSSDTPTTTTAPSFSFRH